MLRIGTYPHGQTTSTHVWTKHHGHFVTSGDVSRSVPKPAARKGYQSLFAHKPSAAILARPAVTRRTPRWQVLP